MQHHHDQSTMPVKHKNSRHHQSSLKLAELKCARFAFPSPLPCLLLHPPFSSTPLSLPYLPFLPRYPYPSTSIFNLSPFPPLLYLSSYGGRGSTLNFPAGSGVEPRPSTHFCGFGAQENTPGDSNFRLPLSAEEVKFKVRCECVRFQSSA